MKLSSFGARQTVMELSLLVVLLAWLCLAITAVGTDYESQPTTCLEDDGSTANTGECVASDNTSTTEEEEEQEEFEEGDRRDHLDARLTDFWVAGVNLGGYKLQEDLEQIEDTAPFELFEDFDIGHLLQGHEGWQDILNIRKDLQRPSWSFYVDKVARKRWVPTQEGIDQAHQIVQRYGSELPQGDRVKEAEAIHQLLHNQTNFCAKPNHFSETGGIWLTSQHPVTNETVISSRARVLTVEEGKEYNNWDIASDLAHNLHEIAPEKESWALKNVQSGFVVEERFSHVESWETPPWEFCIFVIWGRVWLGQFNYVEDQKRWTGAYFNRNGTPLENSYDRELPELVDWDYLVETAERLGANKDMFRADFLVGRPSGDPSMAGASTEEMRASMRHILSESEVFPTTLFFSSTVPQEGARLWMAGYKIGNYKVVSNTEVPDEFLRRGRLSDPSVDNESARYISDDDAGKDEAVDEEDDPGDQDELIDEFIQWIRANGGYVDARQKIVRQRPGDLSSPLQVIATRRIKPGDTLLKIPWKLMVTPDDPDESDLCETVLATIRELDRLHNGTSDKAPYMRLLQRMSKPVMVPDGWSDVAQNLLSRVTGYHLPPQNIGGHTRWLTNSCGVDPEDEEALRIALFVIAHRSGGFFTPGGNQQEVMMPFLNFYSHRDEPFYNTKLGEVFSGKDIDILASQHIREGALIHGSGGYGVSLGTPNLLKDGGIVEDYPRRFTMKLPGEHDSVFEIDFILQVPFVDSDDIVVKWPEGRPASSKAFDAVQGELNRLETLQGLFDGSVVPPEQLSSQEFSLVQRYYFALKDGLRRAIDAATGPWSHSPYTQTDYWVAGVNLGEYRFADELDTIPDQPPYELFEDFDISDLLQGHEDWQDILKLRKTLHRPSWRFYIDKVARKRWIPTQGIDQAKQLVVRYGSELDGAGSVEKETAAIYRLLPNNTNYCAKPNHFSETGGIWLVSQDPITNETMISSKARSLNAAEGKQYGNMDVAQGLATNLHEIAPERESWALQHVHPGFSVEERFSHVTQWERPPWEFCVFVIWGRVWVTQYNYVEDQKRWTGAFFYRNGTAVKGSFDKKVPDIVDWEYLMKTAERLGANKDMFRADFLVGRPSSAPPLPANASTEEMKASLRHILGESEVFPTTWFFSDAHPQDGARLWMAGYKKGNYKVVPNTEIPNEFLETGRLSEQALSDQS